LILWCLNSIEVNVWPIISVIKGIYVLLKELSLAGVQKCVIDIHKLVMNLQRVHINAPLEHIYRSQTLSYDWIIQCSISHYAQLLHLAIIFINEIYSSVSNSNSCCQGFGSILVWLLKECPPINFFEYFWLTVNYWILNLLKLFRNIIIIPLSCNKSIHMIQNFLYHLLITCQLHSLFQDRLKLLW